MSRKRRAVPANRDRPAPREAHGGRVALALFLLALGIRLLFWRAAPNAAGAFHPAYEGDSPLWLDWARAIRQGVPYELDLPLHPPGTAYLVAALWNGAEASVALLRALWCALGAGAVALAYLAFRRSFGAPVAGIAALILAGSGSLLVLSASIDSEAPYLVLVGASFLLHDELLQKSPRRSRIALWALAQAVAVLFRVEHALFAALCWGWFAWIWARRGDGATALLRRSALGAGVALLALAPWHIAAWSAVARLNSTPQPPSAAEAAFYEAVERRTAHLVWEEPAQRWRDALPAVARRPVSLFVAATVARRGRTSVGEADLGALEEAFGVEAAALGPLPRRFFVSLYGPLNFALANHAEAIGGFSTRVLEHPPPLAGGAARYPPELIAGLPPPELALAYPPHLSLVENGYTIGGRWIAAHPLDFARLAARKLAIFWSGAATGLTGYNVPVGWAGPRRDVDMAAPHPGPVATLWQLALLGLALAGAWKARAAALAPWLIFLASKVAVTILFFGYARQGALVVPVVALTVALAVAPRRAEPGDASAPGWPRHLPAAAGLALLAAELVRYVAAT